MSQTVEVIFDGNVFRPTEPVKLKPNTRMEIIISNEKEEWNNFSQDLLNGAFGEDEPEYSINSVRKRNPEYDGS